MTASRTISADIDSKPTLGPTSDIPDKLYFKIGEVAQLVGVQAHVLRYWEKEVPSIRPSKSASNQRRYRRRDVEIFREIRRLLHEERYTLAGAKRRIAGAGRSSESAATEVSDGAAAESTAMVGRMPTNAPIAAADASTLSPELSGEKRRSLEAGLKDLIRLVGEEP